MYYEPSSETSGLEFNPFKSCCVPRPIGWISTVSAGGVHNLAPYSQFQNVTYDPPTVLFIAGRRADGTPKDSVANAIETEEFVWNMATYDLAPLVAGSSEGFGPEVDEFEVLDIETVESTRVRPLRVAASPVHFECKLRQVVDVAANTVLASSQIVIGEVVGIHIADDALTPDGRLDIARLKPLARLGYLDYTFVDKVFEVVGARGRSSLTHHGEVVHDT